jgi:NAD(P)-dependent dehydrogenase (short-subunit alcohol dehydrogenase family)
MDPARRLLPVTGEILAQEFAMQRIVVITGGTAGVGRATACRFAREGAAVAILARGREGLAATAAEIERAGGKPLAIETDVADASQVEHAAARIEHELGPIDVWINNAMTTAIGPFEDITPDEYQRITDVCYHGFVWGTRAALRHMRPRRRGTIIQVGSALAYRSIPLQSAYCGAKHAIHGFTDAIRSELLHDGIPIALCMVQLPAVNTPQFDWCVNRMPAMAQPVPPIFQPEIIAEALHRASRHPRREIFLGWSAVKAILGTQIVPGLADRYLARRGYEGQFTRERNEHPPSNLFEPVSGTHAAHGRFDDAARSRDVVARITTVLGAAGVRATAAVAFAVAAAVLTSAVIGLANRR